MRADAPRAGVNMIYIIRHGQTEKNKANLLQGRSEHPLNETGIRQAQEAGEWFAEHGIIFDAVYSSPLERAKDTGRIAAGKGSNFWPHIDERRIEMEYGPYEGVDLRTPPPEIIEFFSDFVHNPAPEGMEQGGAAAPEQDFVKTSAQEDTADASAGVHLTELSEDTWIRLGASAAVLTAGIAAALIFRRGRAK